MVQSSTWVKFYSREHDFKGTTTRHIAKLQTGMRMVGLQIELALHNNCRLSSFINERLFPKGQKAWLVLNIVVI